MKLPTYFTRITLILMLLAGILSGCAQGDQTQPAGTKTQQAEKNEASFPVTVTDDAGNEITLEEKPEKIVSLLPSTTEILFALGLGDEIVGVSDYDNYPEAAAQKEKVGAQDMNAEKIIALQPDIAFLQDYHAQNHGEIIKQYEAAGIKVFIVGSQTSFDQVYTAIRTIGKATDTLDKADSIINDMDKKVASIKEKAKEVKDPKRVWIEVSPQPEIYTTGKGTFMNEMLEMIGAENVAASEEGWVKMDEEKIVSSNPDTIITTYGYYVENPAEQVLTRSGWNSIKAVQSKQVFDVNSDLVTRPGPRLADGAEELGRLIYPDIFKK
ncbi:ABC transporter substrate-binding protein [Metabacillus indicus]|uniref:ABC transporter substrate-binding protein n=1 Tax=Metabacillus indicus TaxID=246786 RepID=UPI00249055B4|nr:ABC transporter substrate-binding protein [Metabacillus indicus]